VNSYLEDGTISFSRIPNKVPELSFASTTSLSSPLLLITFISSIKDIALLFDNPLIITFKPSTKGLPSNPEVRISERS
jgi:hypothetical protein